MWHWVLAHSTHMLTHWYVLSWFKQPLRYSVFAHYDDIWCRQPGLLHYLVMIDGTSQKYFIINKSNHLDLFWTHCQDITFCGKNLWLHFGDLNHDLTFAMFTFVIIYDLRSIPQNKMHLILYMNLSTFAPGLRLVDNSVINICRHLSTHIKVKTSGRLLDSKVAHKSILHYQYVCEKVIHKVTN